MSTPNWPYPGSRWWKFDFHAHTPASSDFGKGPDQEKIRANTTPRDWLLAFMRPGVECVAVADHNSGSWIPRLQEELKTLTDDPEFKPLVLFPAVEISANEGVHILAIFDVTASEPHVVSLLGACGWQGDHGCSDHVTDKSASEVVEQIIRAGALPVLAHVDEPKTGAFARLSGPTLAKLLDIEGIAAVELVDPNWPFPQIARQRAITLPRVLGTDPHHLAGASGQQYPGSRFTWVKMAKPTIEGLRLALLDGDGISIRRSDDPAAFHPFQTPEHFVESIKIDGFRYMGRGGLANLQLSPLFNALIGGRGTGKSTVVHALRLAFRREGDLRHLDEGSESRRTFERFNREAKNRDDEGGLIQESSLCLTYARDGVRHRIWWHQRGSDIVVEEERNGAWERSESQSVAAERFPVRIFSQGQIVALAGDRSQALLDLIDQAAGSQTSKNALDEARQRYFSLRAQIRDFETKLKGRDELVVQLRDVERKLARFEEAKHAEVLKGYQIAKRQNGELDRQFERARTLAAQIRDTADTLEMEEAPPDVFDPETDTDPLGAIQRLSEKVAGLREQLSEIAASLESAAQSEEERLSASDWKKRIVKAEEAYHKLQEQLRQQGIEDPGQYARLVQERQRLEKERKRLDELEKKRGELNSEAEVAYTAVVEARLALTKSRQTFLTEKLSENAFVRIDIVPWGRDALALESSLRDLLRITAGKYEGDIYSPESSEQPARGLVADLLSGLPAEEIGLASERLIEVIDRAKVKLLDGCQGRGGFGAWFNRYLSEEFQKRPELADHIRCWFPEDGLSVEYSRKGDGSDFQPIAQASAGQRAAALLAFLLAHGEEPLILDQPEDDLDNHLIYDLVVRQIRENKLHRQLIVVTHNPNIVVNGDAEMVHAFDFRDGQCRVVQSGSLQDKPMRDEVCRIMEGGREAFERRYRRLGKGSDHV